MLLWQQGFSCMRLPDRGEALDVSAKGRGSDMEPIAWLVLLAIFLAVEAATAGLTTIWFAAGALAAGAAAYFGGSIVLQLMVFFVVSVLLLIFTRPAAMRLMNQSKHATNVNSLVGKRALVTEEIDNLRQMGKVQLQDIDWMARSSREDIKIEKNAVVIIREVRGVTLIVDKE